MGKPLVGIEWDKVQVDYMTGQLNCTELSVKYGIPETAIFKRCSREKWKDKRSKAVQIVSERTIERVIDKKMARIQEHHDLIVPIAETLCKSVLHSHDSMQGEPIDSAHLNGLAQTLKTANMVALTNLGWVQQTAVDVTSGGQSLHANALAILASCRKLQESGQLGTTTSDIDVEGLLAEQAESRRLESEQ